MARSEKCNQGNKRLVEEAKLAFIVGEFAELFKGPPAATSGSRRAGW
jgi:hypothetical protein